MTVLFDIESAPKDGTWIRLWRGECPGPGVWQPEVIGRWYEYRPEVGEDGAAYGTWAWPDEFYDPYFGVDHANQLIEQGHCYEDNVNFTHWAPLLDVPD